MRGTAGTEDVRAGERRELRARLRTVIVPGLERLADPTADAAELMALADAQARRLRAELESPAPPEHPSLTGAAECRAREDEREWVRGHLHDTALQILEFIAGDGFDTGLTAAKIAQLAGGAARDLRRWIDAAGDRPDAQLVPELERVAAQARTLDASVRLDVGEVGAQPTGEQVCALTGAVREAVTNARKHAHASEVVVSVQRADDGATAVTIADDGVGFDPARTEGGLGLTRSILGRMDRAGGHAELETAPGGGTLVTLRTTRREAAP